MSLLNTLSIAGSAFTAAGARLNNAASNLANMNSAGYKAGRVNLAEGPAGGVIVESVTRDPDPGYLDTDGQEMSNVDPIREVVDMMTTKVQYSATAHVVRATDGLLGTLLDIRR